MAGAASVFARIKRTPALSVESYLSQQQLGTRELSPFQERVLAILSERSRSAKRIGAVMQAYADLVLALPPPSQASFMPALPPEKSALWESAVQAVLAAEAIERQAAAQKEKARQAAAQKETERQAAAFAQKHPKKRINWCNMTEAEQDRAWGWRGLRNAMVRSLGNKASVWLCTTGIFSDKLQLTIDLTSVSKDVRPGLESAIRDDLGKHAKKVMERDKPHLIYEVSWPVEPATIEWEPQEPTRTPAKPEGLQPALFQSLLRNAMWYNTR